jgi:hypothetical protein
MYNGAHKIILKQKSPSRFKPRWHDHDRLHPITVTLYNIIPSVTIF